MAQSTHAREETLVELVLNASTMYGYFIRDRRGIFSDVLARRFDAPRMVEDMPYWMIQQGNVDPDSVSEWLRLFAAIDRGERSGSAMVVLKSDDGDFGQYWLRFDVVSDAQGQPFFAMITSDNFTELYQQFRTKDNDINALLQATQRTFPEVLTLDLTKDSCRVIHYDDGAIQDIPVSGGIDDMVRTRLGGVKPEDRESFSAAFSYERLKKAFLQNEEESLQLVYRRLGKDGSPDWMETTVMRQENAAGSDVLLVAMSRNVDTQKAEELRLRDQLRQQKEELRLTMSQMGKSINYYDVGTSTFTAPPTAARQLGFPAVMDNFPESFIALEPVGYGAEALKTIQAFYDAIRRGEPVGSCEYMFQDAAGANRWERLEFATIFDDRNRPVRAVVAAENVTRNHDQAAENQRLKENEYLLRLMAQHSDRIVCHYDIEKRMADIWDPETCAKCQLPHLCEMSAQAVLESGGILPESLEELQNMFQDIEDGRPRGEIKIRAKVRDSERRWFDVKYSTVYDVTGTPVSAIISHKDITEQYEHELAYRRYVQSIEFDAEGHLLYIESDLTADRIDKLAGQMLSPEAREVQCSFSEFTRQMLEESFPDETREEAAAYFSTQNLLTLYAQEERQLKSEWQVRSRSGGRRWLETETVLMAEPYNSHIKAFIRMMDVTEEKQAQMAVQQRSERDGMTGLLNRATAEDRVREMVADTQQPGILILLDLDDLKGINDTFGHKEGDRAILGITETLKTHFRESDIIGRLGGDEFLIYLPGAAENSDSIAISLATLLRKLSGISIGAGDERRIHCSIGCAVQLTGVEDYENLFKQADTALYHVKRSGKNNYAFYVPEMDQANYEFQVQKLLSQQSVKKFELSELQHLLNSIAAFFQLVLSVNLSTNDYYLMEEIKDGVFAKVPTYGALDQFIRLAANGVHSDDMSAFFDNLSREALLQAYERGEKNLRHYFRFHHEGKYRWIEGIVIFYVNEQGDVCDFTLLRWADERADELNQLWLQKVLELAVVSSFEYICLVNLVSGEYFLFGDEKNTHGVPERGSFDEVTREIRDRFIAPEERDAYYKNAKISTIMERMRDGDGTYTYQYNMPDGPRQAAFHWFEPSQTQVLMTVQRGS